MRKYALAIGTATALSSLLIGGTIATAQDSGPSTTGASTSAPSTVASTTAAPTTAASTTVAGAPVPAAVGTFTLPLLGSPLTVTVTTDAGGGLLDVSLAGAGAAALPVDAVKPGKVAFVNEAGTVKVKVSAKDGGERVQVRAGALADISGPGSWSGDIFGNGTTTTVNFTVAAGSDGGPDITGVTANPATGATVGAVERSTETEDDGEIEQEAKVTITFTLNGQTRKLTIKAEVETENGVTESKLRISLGRLKGAAIADGPAVGPHTWSGTLCDGTAATISYTVNADGSISGVTSTPAAEVSGDGDEVKVRFTSGDRVRIETDDDDDVITVRVRERFNCDRVIPTVNGQQVSTSTTIDDDDDDDDEDRRGRDDDDDDDDATSTTVDDDDDDDDDNGGRRGGDDDDDNGGDDDSDD